MPVRDIFASGGKLPEPSDKVEGEPKKKSEFMDDIEEAAKRGSMLRAFTQSAGFNPLQQQPAPPTQKEEEKINIDLAGIFKSQSDIVNNALNKVTEMQNKPGQTTEENLFVKYLIDELKEVKMVLNRPVPPAANPLDVFVDTQQKMEKLASVMKDHLGISPTVAGGRSDKELDLLVRLEEMKLDSSERDRVWRTEMLTMQRNWEREDKKWAMEFEQKKQEYQDANKNRTQARDMFGDLIGSVVTGIDAARQSEEGLVEEGVVRPVLRSKPAETTTRVPKSFRCQKCGNVIQVESPESVDAACHKCGAEYDLTGGKGSSSEAKAA